MIPTENYVVGIGEALWDILPDGKKLGGAPANFAYHVSQFGFKTQVVSAIGDDCLGDEIVAHFREKRLDTLIEKVDYPTGTVQIKLDEAGVPCYEIRENVAWDNIPFTEKLKHLAEHTSAVCFGSLAQRSNVSRSTINAFLDVMPSGEGRYKIFDINLRQHFYTRDIIVHSMEKCNVLKINDEELVTICKMLGIADDDLQRQCRTLFEQYHLDMLILTCGVDGSYVFTRENVSFVETPKVKVADTVGAGDSFTATFISAILKGKKVRDAHQLAVEVSAFVCTQNGAMPKLPERFLM